MRMFVDLSNQSCPRMKRVTWFLKSRSNPAQAIHVKTPTRSTSLQTHINTNQRQLGINPELCPKSHPAFSWLDQARQKLPQSFATSECEFATLSKWTSQMKKCRLNSRNRFQPLNAPFIREERMLIIKAEMGRSQGGTILPRKSSSWPLRLMLLRHHSNIGGISDKTMQAM